MTKENQISKSEYHLLADELANTFIQRHDLYSRQLEDGSYVCIRKPLKHWHLEAHLKGEITLGAYILDPQSRARFIVIDADDELQFERLIEVAEDLAHRGVPSYLEASRRGGHLWLFFDQPVAGRDARKFGLGLLSLYNLEGIELFPKQDRLDNGPGSLIRLPFGVHQKSGECYNFYTAAGTLLAHTLKEQISALSDPQTVPETVLEAVTEWVSKKDNKAAPNGAEATKGTLSERIKASVTVLDFVSQYVELSANGRGLCPFHDDRRKSFAVNAEENYWNCFAGCGGGSVIDFYMKYNDCDFKSALKELAQTLNLK